MKDVHKPVKVSQFRQHLFEWLDESRNRPVIIERGKERYRLSLEPVRKALGTGVSLPGLAPDPETLPEFSPATWMPDDLS